MTMKITKAEFMGGHKEWRFADMREEGIREKLEHDADCRRYMDYIYGICNGEIVFDESDGELVGYVFIKMDEERGFIFNLFVKDVYRRQGIGGRLLDDAIRKYDGYDLLVDAGNNIAIVMYEKRGFEIADIVDGKYYMKRNGEFGSVRG